MLVEAVVFRVQKGLDDDVGDIIEGNGISTFFAEFADERAVTRVYTHRYLQPHVPQRIDGGQAGQQIPDQHRGAGCGQEKAGED